MMCHYSWWISLMMMIICTTLPFVAFEAALPTWSPCYISHHCTIFVREEGTISRICFKLFATFICFKNIRIFDILRPIYHIFLKVVFYWFLYLYQVFVFYLYLFHFIETPYHYSFVLKAICAKFIFHMKIFSFCVCVFILHLNFKNIYVFSKVFVNCYWVLIINCYFLFKK